MTHPVREIARRAQVHQRLRRIHVLLVHRVHEGRRDAVLRARAHMQVTRMQNARGPSHEAVGDVDVGLGGGERTKLGRRAPAGRQVDGGVAVLRDMIATRQQQQRKRACVRTCAPSPTRATWLRRA
jgi:hypothetical protein